MTEVNRVLFSVLLYVTSFYTHGQFERKVFTTEHGLSSNKVTSIEMDKNGYLWIATSYGLNKFDGVNNTIFRHNPLNPSSIPVNSLGSIYIDGFENIWISLEVGGVSKYNIRDNTFTTFVSDNIDHLSAFNYLSSLHVDRNNNAWVGTFGGLGFIQSNNNKYALIDITSQNSIIHDIVEDKDGNLWVATDKGLLVKYVGSKSFQVIPTNKKDQNEIISFQQVVAGEKIWAVSYDNGLYELNGQYLNRVISIKNDYINLTPKGQSIEVSTLNSGSWALINGKWQRKAENSGLIYTSQKSTLQLLQYKNGALYIKEKNSSGKWKIQETRDDITSYFFYKDILWVGTKNNGLVSYYKKNEGFSYVEKPNVKALILDKKDQRALAITGNSLFDITGNKVIANLPFPLNHIVYDVNGNMWAASNKGLYCLNKSKITQHYYGVVLRMFLMDNQIWMITETGLQLFNIASRKLEPIYFDHKTPNVFKFGYLMPSIFVDKFQNIWIGTIREGLYKISQNQDKKTYTAQNYKYLPIGKSNNLESQTINAIQAKGDSLIIGCYSAGLLTFNPKTEKFSSFQNKGSNPIPNIRSIEKDDRNTYWISAADGIYYLEKKSKRPTKYLSLKKLKDQFYVRNGSLFFKEQIYFAGSRGISSIKTEEVKTKTSPRTISISSIMVKGTKIKRTADQKLRYHQNTLEIEFFAPNYKNPKDVIYSYKLIGGVNQWIYVENNRKVRFEALKEGKYSFVVRASNDGVIWSNPDTFNFEITPPTWKEPWFFVLLLITFFYLLYLRISFVRNIRRQKARQLQSFRIKAVADFHDEVGTRLTRISLLSELLEKDNNNIRSQEELKHLRKIQDNSRNLNDFMKDFLWVMDPKKDTLGSLITSLREGAEDILEDSKIAITFKTIVSEKARAITLLNMEMKRHILLIFKESIYNILKHSCASSVLVTVAFNNGTLQLKVVDNGIGFSSGSPMGYGISNMKQRAKKLMGNFDIHSSEKGTSIILSCQISKIQ